MLWSYTDHRIPCRVDTQFPTLNALTAILELGTFLEMDVARTFAIHTLGAQTVSLSAALRLSLAISFRVAEWIEPAFKELVATPPHLISVGDFSLLGGPVAHLIVATKSAICYHCLFVTYNPFKPPEHDPTCKWPIDACQGNWEAAWWDGLARHYLHPDYPSSPQEIIQKLENTPIIGVTTACRLHAVQIIKDQRVFKAEDDIQKEALHMINQFERTSVYSKEMR